MAMSPNLDTDGVAHLTITSDGRAIPDAARLISVTAWSAVNQVPRATLVFQDGDGAEQTFSLSDATCFRCGAAIEVKAGRGEAETMIFGGVVVRHGLSIAGDGAPRLTIECRDRAVAMTQRRRNAQYRAQSDAEVITQLIQAHGLTARVASTTTVHESLIQHDGSDWDYLLARAAACGCLVIVSGGTVDVAAPRVSDAAAIAVEYGVDLIAFEAELDADPPYGQPPSGAGSGPAQAPPLDARMARLRGRMRLEGSALPAPGRLVVVKGLGERFSGPVFVAGVTHQLDAGNWTSDIEFGLPQAWLGGRGDGMVPGAGGSVPGIGGLHAGVVLQLDGDPSGEHRVQVSVPSAGVEAVWARLLQFSASAGFGALFAPEVGDEVLIGWFDDDPRHPVVLGSLYGGQHPPPTPLSAGNGIKTLVTRCKARLEFDDEHRVITLLTPGENRMVFSDQDRAIVITDANGNTVELGTGGIRLDSPGDIRISARGSISIEAVGAVRVGAQTDVHVAGLNVNCTAQVGMVAQGAATAELTSSGQTTVKGGLVLIN